MPAVGSEEQKFEFAFGWCGVVMACAYIGGEQCASVVECVGVCCMCRVRVECTGLHWVLIYVGCACVVKACVCLKECV